MAVVPDEAMTPPPNSKLKYILPGIVVGLFALAFLGLYIHGTWASSSVKNPASSNEGIVTQLIQAPGGSKQVRCALVIDEPAPVVWKAVTDYEHFKEIFPILTASSVAQLPDNKRKLSSSIHSSLGNWDFEVDIKHSESEKEYVASWNQPSTEIKVNRGNWTITPLDAKRALAVYTLEVDLNKYPAFFVRCILLSQQQVALQSVKDWLKKNPYAK